MSQLSTILGAYAVGHQLYHEGRTYTFPRVSQKVKDALATAYFKRAREAVYATKEETTEEEYGRALEAVRADWTRGRYAFPFGESFAFFMGDGMAEFLSILCVIPKEEAEQLVQERTIDVQHVLLCVVGESFPNFKQKLLKAEEQGLLKDLMNVLNLLQG